jgi:hypothetical protein
MTKRADDSKRMLKVVGAVPVLLLIAMVAITHTTARVPADPRLVLVRQHEAAVVTTRSPGAEGIRFGFEGGRAVKVGGRYHLFTSEMIDDPMWVKMRLGHWSSEDRIRWTRVATIRESSGEIEGKDPRAALWSPLPVWDEQEERWNLFYVAYHAARGDGTRFMLNHEGRIWRAVSRTRGAEGIGGPYDDVGVVMEPGDDSLPWEGLQGTASFFPWRVGSSWLALYGSARTEKMPIEHWLVGLASAPALGGPWTRLRASSPVPIEKRFIENPIVTPAPGGGWLAVYDHERADAVGWTYSADGRTWQQGRALVVQPRAGVWAKDVRTPLGLISEGDGRFTMLYTGFEKTPDWDRLLTGRGRETCAIGFVEVRVDR